MEGGARHHPIVVQIDIGIAEIWLVLIAEIALDAECPARQSRDVDVGNDAINEIGLLIADVERGSVDVDLGFVPARIGADISPYNGPNSRRFRRRRASSAGNSIETRQQGARKPSAM